MADTLYADLADSRLPAILGQELMLSRQDRMVILNHPALFYAGDVTNSGSTVIKQSELDFMAAHELAAVADGAAVTPTTLTDTSYNVTVARRAKSYAPTDLARLTDSYGALDPQKFAEDATLSAGMTLTSLIAQLMGGFSNVFGTSGSDLTLQDFEDAVTSLEIANVEGPYLSILAARQWGDMRDAIRTATGTVAFDPASPEMIRMRGTGYKGSIYGVDMFVSNKVATANAGADFAGGVFGRGAVLWADASVPTDPSVIGVNAGKVLLEYDRNALSAVTNFVSNYYLGVAEGDDARGAAIITDA
jgi:hypothetical protein